MLHHLLACRALSSLQIPNLQAQRITCTQLLKGSYALLLDCWLFQCELLPTCS